MAASVARRPPSAAHRRRRLVLPACFGLRSSGWVCHRRRRRRRRLQQLKLTVSSRNRPKGCPTPAGTESEGSTDCESVGLPFLLRDAFLYLVLGEGQSPRLRLAGGKPVVVTASPLLQPSLWAAPLLQQACTYVRSLLSSSSLSAPPGRPLRVEGFDINSALKHSPCYENITQNWGSHPNLPLKWTAEVVACA